MLNSRGDHGSVCLVHRMHIDVQEVRPVIRARASNRGMIQSGPVDIPKGMLQAQRVAA